MKPESASSNRRQHAQGNNSAPVFVSDDPARRSVISPPLGLRLWTRHILEFVPLWLVLAACAGWFTYGCGLTHSCDEGGTVTGPTTVAAGAQVQLTLKVNCVNSQPAATWSASPSGYLSVDATGSVTGLSPTPTGTPVTVTATYTGGSANSAPLTVTGPTLQSITVTDAVKGDVFNPGSTDQFTAVGTYSDGTTLNLTDYMAWASSVTGVAYFSGEVSGAAPAPSGDAYTKSAGETLITASIQVHGQQPITGSELLTVGALQSITVTDADKGTVSAGSTDQFAATGIYAGGVTQNITALVTWTSGTAAVATIVANTGVATGLFAGQSLITASLTVDSALAPPTTVSGTETLKVVGVAPTLVSIAVTPATASVAAGLTQQYTATGTYSSGPPQVLTTGVTWASSDTAAATINGSGLATGDATGSSTVTAAVGSIVSPGVTLTVTAPVLESIAVTPTTASIQVGQTEAYTATGTYSNQTTAPLTTGVLWTSTPTTVATITFSGVATGVTAGTATISALVGNANHNSATLTVTPAVTVSKSRYLLDLSTNGISVDAIVPGTGQLRASNIALIPSLEEAAETPYGLLVDPQVPTVYLVSTLSGGLQITQYYLGANGEISGGVYDNNDNWTGAPVVDPLGRFLYVADSNQSEIWFVPLDSAGNLGTPAVAVTGATNTGLMAIDPTGTYLYSESQNETSITSYAIGPSGTLTLVGTATGPANPQSLAVAPSGKVLYALSYGDIYAYSLSAGVLTPLPSSPFTVPSSGEPAQFAIDPGGSYLYVTENNPDGVFGFTIGSDGSLTIMQSGTEFPAGKTPRYINVDQGSHFLYVNNFTSDDIWVYSIASGTGLLTNVSEIRTAAHTGQAIVSGTAALTFTPTQAFVTNEDASTITQYTIDPTTGNLSPLSTPIGAGDDPVAVATDPFGLYAYAASDLGGANVVGQVFGYTISSSGLSSLSGNPFAAGAGPTWLTTDLSGSFLYTIMDDDTDVWKYDLVSGVPTGGAKTVSTSGTAPVFIVSEPTGQYFYVADIIPPTTIEMYRIDLPGGSLAANGTLAVGLSQTSIAVDPSGRYAYSAEPSNNAVWEYTINTSGVLALNTTSSVPAGPTPPGPGAYSVVVEPTGEYLYVSNYTSNQIYAFSIAPSTGLLTQVQGSLSNGAVADTGTTPTELAVDISGQYLYCVNQGTSISIYSISLSNGFLTSVGTVNVAGSPGGFTTTGTVQ